MKKLVSLLLALLLMFGCAYAAEYAPAITDEPVTLTCMRYIRDIDNIDMSDLWFNNHLEELTGVHIEYTAVSQSDFPQQLNLMYASGEYPDLVIDCNNNVDLEMYGVEQGVYIPLDDIIDDYMPNYKALMETGELYYAATKASDGHIYCTGYIADSNDHTSAGYLFINKVWLEELGLDMPTSMDELYEVLLAFKEAHPDGYIWEDIFSDLYTYYPQLWGFTDSGNWMSITEEGVVRFNGTLQNFRDMLEFISKCYEAGILDPDCLTQDQNTKISKLNQNNIGMAYLWRLRSMGWDCLVDTMTRLDCFPADGYDVVIKMNLPIANKQVFITKSCEDVETAAKWIDYQFSPQMVFEGFYGPEDGLWSWNEDGKCQLGAAGDQECVKWAYGVNTVCFMPGPVYNTYFQQPDYRIERINYAAEVEQYYETYTMQYVLNIATPTGDEVQEVAKLKAQIDSLMKESIADFIRNGITDETWDAFQEELLGAGIERYVEIYQGVFDNYMGL